jgi:hypothetical protein
MTIQTQGSVQSQVLELIPRDYEVFGGFDVNHHSIAATFTDQGVLWRKQKRPGPPTKPSLFLHSFTAVRHFLQLCIREVRFVGPAKS